MLVLEDRLHRPLRNLRLSVTDRCNLRCSYCMPEEEYVVAAARRRADASRRSTGWCDVFVGLGRRQGAPDRRRAAPAPRPRRCSCACSPASPGCATWRMTTNGVLLAEQAAALRARRPASRHGQPRHACAGIASRRSRGATSSRACSRASTAAAAAGFAGAQARHGRHARRQRRRARRSRRVRARASAPRCASSSTWTWAAPRSWTRRARGVARRDARAHRRALRRRSQPSCEATSARPPSASASPTARRFGIIASTTAPFCAACDRAASPPTAIWYSCLYARDGTDLRGAAARRRHRRRARRADPRAWHARADRGAEERLRAARPPRRSPGRASCARDPHLEMHTRGG